VQLYVTTGHIGGIGRQDTAPPVPLTVQIDAGGAATFLRGDATRSGALELSDAIRVLATLFQGAPPLPCPDAADANDDRRVDISDAVFILGYLFLGTAAPPAPGPSECGPDPTADELPGCEAAGDACGQA
jgi:hypothetical protein